MSRGENKYFEELLSSIGDNQYVGLGNPNAKILFIGKEAGIQIGSENFHGSPNSWKSKNFNYSNRYVPEESRIKNYNHTWQRNQKLYENILSLVGFPIDKSDKYEITFVEKVFTTELSNLHAPNTIDAKRQVNFIEELSKRKEVFFKSNFINQFPIVVIFASDKKYIETYSGEVSELFGVKFEKIHDELAKDKIRIYYSENTNLNLPKIVIHTRQLTNRITNELIPNLSVIIADFIKKHSISI